MNALFRGDRSGEYALLRDLHDLWLLAHEVQVTWEVLKQGAHARRDAAFADFCHKARDRNDRQIAWIKTRVDTAGPQALLIPA